MAEVTAIVPFKINTFSDGTDDYPNLKSISWQESPLPTYAYRDEGDTRPSAIYDLPSDSPRFSGTITGDSSTLKALSGTTKTSCTINATNAKGNVACTITISNATFKAVSGGATEGAPSPHSISFEATDIAVANDA